MKKKTHKTFNPSIRWNVIEIDHNEQNPGGQWGKRRIKNNKPLRRERAEVLKAHCEEMHQQLVEMGSKNRLSFILEEAN